MDETSNGWTGALAAQAHIDAARMTDDVRRVGKTCVLDWLAVAIAGSNETAPRVVRAVANPGSSPLIGGGTAALVDAVRVNGTAGHVLDYDDVQLTMLGHPTAPVLPALLSAAPTVTASGEEFLAAFVGGVEVIGLVGSWIARSSQDRGFHTTAQLGILAAAAASSRLLGLDATRTASAIGLAATSSAGLKSAFGTMAKSMQVGRAASEGLYSALLTRAGADAPADLLEAEAGFAAAYAGVALDGPVRMSGHWEILQLIFKYYPCCYMTHSSIESGVDLFGQGLDADAIREVELTVAPRSAELCDNPSPATALEAKFSLSWTLASALVTSTVSSDTFTQASLTDDRIRAVNDRVRVLVVDDHPEFASVVRVRTSSGEWLERCVDVALPMPVADLARQWDKVTAKTHDLLTPIIGARAAERLIDLVDHLEELESIEPIWEVCGLPLVENGSGTHA